MCFDKNVSLAAFVIAMVSGLFALFFKMPILGCLIIIYGQMQLSELLIWQGIDDDNENLNNFGTIWGKYSLPLHNIAIAIGILISYRKCLNDIYYWIPLIIGIVFYFVVLVGFYSDEDNSTMITKACDRDKETDKCTEHSARLMWPYNHTWYLYSYIISLILLFIYVRPIVPSALFAFLFFTLTWVTTFFMGKHPVQGSFWCWSTAILSPLIVIANYLFIRNMPNVHS